MVGAAKNSQRALSLHSAGTGDAVFSIMLVKSSIVSGNLCSLNALLGCLIICVHDKLGTFVYCFIKLWL